MNFTEFKEALTAYFKSHEDELNQVLNDNDLISYDDRFYSMDEFDEILDGNTPSELARKIFYGYDLDYSNPDTGKYEEFNPNKAYFRFNGYGNLVSTDYSDYSDYIDQAVEYIADNPSHYQCEFDDKFDAIIEAWLESDE